MVQRWMSGSWQAAYVSSVSAGVKVRRHRRSVVRVTGSIGRFCWGGVPGATFFAELSRYLAERSRALPGTFRPLVR